jgi:hypothetical protein
MSFAQYLLNKQMANQLKAVVNPIEKKGLYGGRAGTRTPDLLRVNKVLSLQSGLWLRFGATETADSGTVPFFQQHTSQ